MDFVENDIDIDDNEETTEMTEQEQFWYNYFMVDCLYTNSLPKTDKEKQLDAERDERVRKELLHELRSNSTLYGKKEIGSAVNTLSHIMYMTRLQHLCWQLDQMGLSRKSNYFSKLFKRNKKYATKKAIRSLSKKPK